MQNHQLSKAQNGPPVKGGVGGIRTSQFLHSADDRHLMPLSSVVRAIAMAAALAPENGPDKKCRIMALYEAGILTAADVERMIYEYGLVGD